MSDLSEGQAARAFVAEREWEPFQDPKALLPALVGEVGGLADVLVYLVALADQCGVDLTASALDKIAQSSHKYPVEQHRGAAPDRS